MLTPSLVMSLWALAHSLDNSKPITKHALQTLMVISIKNPEIAFQYSAIQLLLQTLLHHNFKTLHQDILNACLYLVDSAPHRKYIFPNFVSNLLAPLTASAENSVKPEMKMRLMCCTEVLVKMLRSWPGVIYLTSHQYGLNVVVKILTLRNFEVITMMMHSLYELFGISLPDEHKPRKKNPFNTKYLNLVHCYYGILLVSLVECGLGDALLQLHKDIVETPVEIMKKYTMKSVPLSKCVMHLISSLLDLSKYLLPSQQCANLHRLGSVVWKAVGEDPNQRSWALSVLQLIDANTQATPYHPNPDDSRLEWSEIMESSSRESMERFSELVGCYDIEESPSLLLEKRLRGIEEEVRKTVGLIDEQGLMYALKNSGVLSAKDYRLWKWDVIVDLLDGPLKSAALWKVSSKTKFMNRILAFFLPSKQQFTEISNQKLKKSNSLPFIYETPSSSMSSSSPISHSPRKLPKPTSTEMIPPIPLSTHSNPPAKTKNTKSMNITPPIMPSASKAVSPLMSYSVYMQAAEFMVEVICLNSPNLLELLLKELEELMEGPTDSEDKTKYQKFRSSDSMENKTILRKYFPIIGYIYRHPKGREILTQRRIFEHLKEMCSTESHPDILKKLLNSLEYSQFGYSTELLKHVLENKSIPIRLMGVDHLFQLLRSSSNEISSWILKLLCSTLIKEEEQIVTSEILDILNGIALCKHDLIEIIISQKIDLMKYGAPGRNLMYLYMRVPIGFNLLNSTGFIKKQLLEWTSDHNVSYVIELDTRLKHLFNDTSPPSNSNDAYHYINPKIPGSIACHFLGELARSREGCNIIHEYGVFKQLKNNLLSHSDMNKRRAAMWAAGHVVNSAMGFTQFDGAYICRKLVEIASKSSTLSLRGTAFYVLSMLSSLNEAHSIFNQLGWEPNQGLSTIAFPKDFNESGFLKIKMEYEIKEKQELSTFFKEQVNIHDLKNNINDLSVLYVIGKMANNVTAEMAVKLFTSYVTKQDPPEDLKNPKVLYQVYQLLENFKIGIEYRELIHTGFKKVNVIQLTNLFDEDEEIKKEIV
eukprot:TRINITY_DN6555_c0_g3_i1.p1 TRINITY_DN6555_c0_g3~~TRINITY_DN6555_c0_g3_i1.p1  ORF type:complete len:1171 (+),score=304.41 TRINITY_DN6555_c0_g3_i1:383-3514(+)